MNRDCHLEIHLRGKVPASNMLGPEFGPQHSKYKTAHKQSLYEMLEREVVVFNFWEWVRKSKFHFNEGGKEGKSYQPRTWPQVWGSYKEKEAELIAMYF